MPPPFRKSNARPAPPPKTPTPVGKIPLRPKPKPLESTETDTPTGPFKTGYEFAPTEVVTNIKLGDQVDEMVVDYVALAQALLNSGANDANALVRFSNNMLQLRNADTGLWHSIWIAGIAGEEELVIGEGQQ
jgi:hypothetical protein